jgi:uncharacterized membrane protein YdjX (TVP38/TMEM64 family)
VACQAGGWEAGFAQVIAMLRKILADRRLQRIAGAGVLAGVALMLGLWRMGYGWDDAKAGWLAVELFLRDRPWWLFACLVVLPGLPVPTSALMFLAGTVWRDQPVAACGIGLLALVLNMTWTYWLAAGPGRGLVVRLLAKSTYRIPKLPKNNHLRAVLIARLTPGIPLFVQNYALGFMHVPFRLYLPVSIACSGPVACGVVLAGAGVAGGNFAPAVTGVGLIVVGVVVVRWVKATMLES